MPARPTALTCRRRAQGAWMFIQSQVIPALFRVCKFPEKVEVGGGGCRTKDLTLPHTRLCCQTPAPCFISNAGMRDGVPGPRFHHVRSCSCLTVGTGPGVCPGTFTAGVQKCVGWGPVLSCLRGTQETLDLSLCPLPADLSKHTPMGHFLPKRVYGDFSLSAALGEENPGPL